MRKRDRLTVFLWRGGTGNHVAHLHFSWLCGWSPLGRDLFVTRLVVLNDLSDFSAPVCSMCFFLLACRMARCSVSRRPSAGACGHSQNPEWDPGSQEYCLSPRLSAFFSPSVLGYSFHTTWDMKPSLYFKFLEAPIFPILSLRKKAIHLKSSISPYISIYI